jgi:hypothetical protein
MIKLPAAFPMLPALIIQTIQDMHAKKTFAYFQKDARKSDVKPSDRRDSTLRRGSCHPPVRLRNWYEYRL